MYNFVLENWCWIIWENKVDLDRMIELYFVLNIKNRQVDF